MNISIENEHNNSEKHKKVFKRVSSSTSNFKNVPENFDPFDPKLRLNAPHSITSFEAFVHLMKGSFGTGVLAMAHGFTYVGILGGVVLTILCILIQGHCIHLILRCQYFQCKRLGLTCIEYSDCMEDAFKNGPKIFRRLAPAIPYIVDFFMLVHQLGTCACYFIFIAQNLSQVGSIYGFEMHDRVWMLLLLFPVMLLNLIRNLSSLAPISTAGNFTFVLSMGVIFYYFFGYDGSAFDNIDKRDLIVWPPTRWPLFIGTACFALECIAVVVKIEHHMKEPKKFRSPFGVFNMGLVLTTLLFVIPGLCGYLKYGAQTQSSITLNIASDQKLAQFVKVLYAAVIFLTYPLQNFVPIEILWVNYIEQYLIGYSEKKKLIVEYIFRELVVLGTFGFAMIIPHLDLLISLFGAFCLSSLAIIFPALIHLLVIKHEQIGYGFMNWVLIKDAILIVFGVFLMITGTTISIIEIIKAIKGESS